MSIYVAGPVVRPPAQIFERQGLGAVYDYFSSRKDAETRLAAEFDFLVDTYSTIMRSAVRQQFNLFLPEPDLSLDLASPQDFIERIVSRIRQAEQVITVHTPLDAAGPIETAYASIFKKRILIITRHPRLIPRMMLGLPGVTEVVQAGDDLRLSNALANFLR